MFAASQLNGAPVIQSDWQDENNQKFRLVPIEDAGENLFMLRALHSGKVLEVFESSPANGAPIIQSDPHGGDSQLWRIDIQ